MYEKLGVLYYTRPRPIGLGQGLSALLAGSRNLRNFQILQTFGISEIQELGHSRSVFPIRYRPRGEAIFLIFLISRAFPGASSRIFASELVLVPDYPGFSHPGYTHLPTKNPAAPRAPAPRQGGIGVTTGLRRGCNRIDRGPAAPGELTGGVSPARLPPEKIYDADSCARSL